MGEICRRAQQVNQSAPPETFIMGFRIVIVVVMAGQPKEQAWRAHLSKNPADRNADIKIFHFTPQKTT
jgi:hypothetical protein